MQRFRYVYLLLLNGLTSIVHLMLVLWPCATETFSYIITNHGADWRQDCSVCNLAGLWIVLSGLKFSW
jgi:hypothetical protein